MKGKLIYEGNANVLIGAFASLTKELAEKYPEEITKGEVVLPKWDGYTRIVIELQGDSLNTVKEDLNSRSWRSVLFMFRRMGVKIMLLNENGENLLK